MSNPRASLSLSFTAATIAQAKLTAARTFIRTSISKLAAIRDDLFFLICVKIIFLTAVTSMTAIPTYASPRIKRSIAIPENMPSHIAVHATLKARHHPLTWAAITAAPKMPHIIALMRPTQAATLTILSGGLSDTSLWSESKLQFLCYLLSKIKNSYKPVTV